MLKVIQKKEWERLLHQAHPPVVVTNDNKKAEEQKALAEKSQEWVKSWPDTDEGHVKQFLKRKEQRRLQEVTAVKHCERKKKDKDKRITNEAITRARQMIFDNGCYGRELISALLESKMLEEREAQIKLKMEAKEKSIELEKQLQAKETRYIDLDNKHADMERKRKEKTTECAQININTHQCRKIKEFESKEKEKELELEDARLMKELLDYEKEEEVCNVMLKKKCQAYAIQTLNEQVADQKRVDEYRAKREKVDDDVAEVWRAHLARRRRRENQVLDEIHKERQNQEFSQKNFELVQKLQEQADKRFDDFINKGIERMEEIENTKLQQEAATTIANHIKRLELAKDHKSQRKVQPVPMDRNKEFCWKQSLFTTSQEEKTKKSQTNDKTFKNIDKPKLTFLSPPPNARGVVAECKYKNVPRKVVEAYRKLNYLDKHTLPVFDEEIQPFIEGRKY